MANPDDPNAPGPAKPPAGAGGNGTTAPADKPAGAAPAAPKPQAAAAPPVARAAVPAAPKAAAPARPAAPAPAKEAAEPDPNQLRRRLTYLYRGIPGGEL